MIGAAPGQGSLAEHWQSLAAVALLGTDRRSPPAVPDGDLADLVADRHAGDAGEAVLDQVAALGALRRGGLRPGPPVALLDVADDDPRPVCPPAATARLADLLDAWPQLVDEWLGALVSHGWRLAPEAAVPLLNRFRAHPPRRALALQAVGPLGDWLAELFPDLVGPRRTATVPAEPPPLPADVQRLARADADALAAALAEGLESGEFSKRHQPMFERVLCSVPIDHLPAIAARLNRAGTNPHTMGIALSLADLAGTRHAMIQELLP